MWGGATDARIAPLPPQVHRQSGSLRDALTQVSIGEVTDGAWGVMETAMANAVDRHGGAVTIVGTNKTVRVKGERRARSNRWPSEISPLSERAPCGRERTRRAHRRGVRSWTHHDVRGDDMNEESC